MTPEQEVRIRIDTRLEKVGWEVQDAGSVNLYERRGGAVREFGLKPGHGTADYLLCVDQKAAGVVAAKAAGYTLTGVETHSGKYSCGLPETLPAHWKPLPFLYETSRAETRFTNLLDPESRSRNVFASHTLDALAHWVGVNSTPGQPGAIGVAEPAAAYRAAQNLRHRLTEMPALDAGGSGRCRCGLSTTWSNRWRKGGPALWCRWPRVAVRPSPPATKCTG